PFTPALNVGLGEVEVYVVVRGVTGYEQPRVRHPQGARVVGVGVPKLDREEFVAFELDLSPFERLGEHKVSRKPVGEARIPECLEELRRGPIPRAHDPPGDGEQTAIWKAGRDCAQPAA